MSRYSRQFAISSCIGARLNTRPFSSVVARHLMVLVMKTSSRRSPMAASIRVSSSPARASDERFALAVLVLARTLADDDQRRMRIAHAAHDLRARRADGAAAACINSLVKSLERGCAIVVHGCLAITARAANKTTSKTPA